MNTFLLIIALCLLIILVLFHKSIYIVNTSYSVKESKLLKGERGLFAEKDYKAGDVIDECPTVKVLHDHIDASSRLNDYVFQSIKDDDHVLVAMGYCGVMNHSEEKQNATWEIDRFDETITMFAISDIQKGEEIYVNYGEDYWKERNIDEK